MVLVEVVLCIGNHVASHRGLAVFGFQGVEFKDRRLETFGGLHAPGEMHVGGQRALCGFAVEHSVDFGRVGSECHTHDAALRRNDGLTACALHQFGEERVACGGICCGLFFDALGCGRVGSGRVGGGGALGEAVVYFNQSGLQFVERISFPEFEVCASLKQFAHALRFLDARHFHHDLTDLTFAVQHLDVGLSHAEAVDTRAHHLVGVFNGGCHLFGEHFLHLVVRRVVGDILFLELGGKHAAEAVFAVLLLVDRNEDVHEVGAFFLGLLACIGECLGEGGFAGAFTGEALHHVGHAHFEDNVHAAFKVEAETDLQFFAFFECFPVQVHLLVSHGIEVCAAVFALRRELGGFLLVVACHGREREVEKANQSQQHCNYFNKSFVLHCV